MHHKPPYIVHCCTPYAAASHTLPFTTRLITPYAAVHETPHDTTHRRTPYTMVYDTPPKAILLTGHPAPPGTAHDARASIEVYPFLTKCFLHDPKWSELDMFFNIFVVQVMPMTRPREFSSGSTGEHAKQRKRDHTSSKEGQNEK